MGIVIYKLFSVPLIFYGTTFLTAPFLVWLLVDEFNPPASLLGRSGLCLSAILGLLIYRWVFSPYTPPVTSLDSMSRLPSCGSNIQSMVAVYTWVNVTDPDWQDLSDQYGCDTNRYRSALGDADPFEVMRYSMRSVRLNFPYISKFLIITERNQVPTWLDETATDVQVVFHDEYMPEGTTPVFNSHPIEYTLYMLRERGFVDSDCFLYLNDDFLIHKPISLSDVMSSDGRIVFNTVSHVDLGVNAFVDVPFGVWDPLKSHIVDPHVPYVIHAPAFSEFMKTCGSACSDPLYDRCHRQGPMPMELYQTYLSQYHAYLLEFVPPAFAFNMRLPIGAGGMPVWLNRLLIALLRPMFVYIDSHGGVEDDPQYVAMILEYFQTNLVEPATWEVN
jgi:hypothetical protein